MYFPILRGRQFELIALRELIESKAIGKYVVPIIEPVKLSTTLNSTLQAFRSAGRSIAVIRNPRVGDFVGKLNDPENETIRDKFFAEMDQGAFISAYYIDDNDALRREHIEEKGVSLDQCIALCASKDSLNKYRNVFRDCYPMYTLIHDERSIRRSVQGSKVLWDDKFDKKARNTDYAIEADHPFSEDHLYYDEEGYRGVADYSIVGEEYSESGFAPYAVVIHIVYFDDDNALRIHHFVSDTNDTINDPPRKFGEALEKFHEWNKTHKLHTIGAKALEQLYTEQKFPGLGTIKKLSIMHHLELMSQFMDGGQHEDM